jgi:hypothetical protein
MLNLTPLPGYQQVQRPHKFFKPGRCFGVVWSEPAGPSRNDENKNVTKVSYDQCAFTKPSRFISLRNQKGFCVALRIHTFGGRGAEKYTSRPDHLFFVRTADDTTDNLQLEPNRISIRVEDLNITFASGKSIVLASKPYSIEHFLHVKNLGYVEKPSLAILQSALMQSMAKEHTQSIGFSMSSQLTTKKSRACPEQEANAFHRLGNLAGSQITREYRVSRVPVIEESELSKQAQNSQPVSLADNPDLNQRDPGYFCDRIPCPRALQPFHRAEHLLNHLRDYHLEDIPRNRRFGQESKRIAWYTSRAIEKDWWRCKHCLSQVNNSENGWRCMKCGQDCELERREERTRRYTGWYSEGGFLLTEMEDGDEN